MSKALDIIGQVTATGARLVLVQGGVGFDKPIPDDLLYLARDHKEVIRAELEAQATQEGVKRLEEAAKGLPVTLEELQEFFQGDLLDFGTGTGTVTMAGIRKASEWYAFVHMKRSVYWWKKEKERKAARVDTSRRRSIR
jgi:hypothetical protein